MKSIFKIFILSILSCLSVPNLMAERVKPEIPEITLESEKSYYLYNDSTGLFATCDGYLKASYVTPYVFKFTQIVEGERNGQWNIINTANNYLETSSSNVSFCSSKCYDSFFQINQKENGCYTIQRNYNFKESEFLGANKDGDYIYCDATNNTEWHLIPAEDSLVAARIMLYHTLQNMGDNYNVESYDDILSSSVSYQEVFHAAKELNTSLTFTSQYTQRGDYSILFINDVNFSWSKESSNQNGFYFDTSKMQEGQSSRLKAIVDVDVDEATLTYQARSDYYNILNVYIDGELVRTVPYYQNNTQTKYFEILNKGTHTIEWEYAYNSNYTYDGGGIYYIGVYKTPTISVSLLEPGSLGTEILSQVNGVTDVRRLKIKGAMNADDWATLKMIKYLYSVDLSEATITEIPDNAFDDSNGGSTNFHKVVLPKDLETIGAYAFRDTNLDELTLPSTLKTIGNYAFYGTLLKKASIPEVTSSIGDYAFAYCRSLAEVEYPELTYIPSYCFYYNHHLQKINLPKNLKSIESCAFYDCNYLIKINLPSTLQSIGSSAFYSTSIESLIVPEGTTLGSEAFRDCSNLKYIELPTTFSSLSVSSLFYRSSNVRTIKLKSPTVVTFNDYYYGSDFIDNSYRANITLQVPDYLVNAYKLDDYWYNYGVIEGFATSEIETWTIKNPLVLSAKDRFQGNPNVNINYTSWTIKGETGQSVNNLQLILSNDDSYQRFQNSSQVMSSADVSVEGTFELKYYTRGNNWHYVALPFDIKVDDIQCDAQYAIRYYDGASRAANNVASGNWKNYTADDIIPAGTGFIYQTSANAWTIFTAVDNSNKERALRAKDLSTLLDENVSETAAHRGWNLVGNPWMTYFNIHAVDFIAPITVYDQYNNRYQAYSIIDDNVALHPTQAFFVQCPESVNAISFPARGRQLTSTVTDQNGARHRGAVRSRQLIDLTLKCGEINDQTRVVINNDATLGYDYACDASKFFTDDKVAQLYTIDMDGVSYAINERPLADGMVALAMEIPSDGTYQLSITRNENCNVILKDLLKGTETALNENTYEFEAEAGTIQNRFVLYFNENITGVNSVTANQPSVLSVPGGIRTNGIVTVYSLDGRKVAEGEGFINLANGFYIINASGVSTKILVD